MIFNPKRAVIALQMLILTTVGFLRPFGSKRLALLAERQIRPNVVDVRDPTPNPIPEQSSPTRSLSP